MLQSTHKHVRLMPFVMGYFKYALTFEEQCCRCHFSVLKLKSKGNRAKMCVFSRTQTVAVCIAGCRLAGWLADSMASLSRHA